MEGLCEASPVGNTLQGQRWSRELIPGNAQGHLRTLQVCAGDTPGLMGHGTGPPDGQAKVRQGDGPAAGRAGEGGPGTPVSLQMELSRAICPRSARAGSRDLAAEKEKGMPRLGNLEGLGPITGASNSLGTVCASTHAGFSAAATHQPGIPCRNQPPFLLCPTHLGLNTAVTWHHLLASSL